MEILIADYPNTIFIVLISLNPIIPLGPKCGFDRKIEAAGGYLAAIFVRGFVHVLFSNYPCQHLFSFKIAGC